MTADPRPSATPSQHAPAVFDASTAAWVLRAAELLVLASRACGSQAAGRLWLTTPHPGLGGASPIDRAATPEGEDEVRRLLNRL